MSSRSWRRRTVVNARAKVSFQVSAARTRRRVPDRLACGGSPTTFQCPCLNVQTSRSAQVRRPWYLDRNRRDLDPSRRRDPLRRHVPRALHDRRRDHDCRDVLRHEPFARAGRAALEPHRERGPAVAVSAGPFAAAERWGAQDPRQACASDGGCPDVHHHLRDRGIASGLPALRVLDAERNRLVACRGRDALGVESASTRRPGSCSSRPSGMRDWRSRPASSAGGRSSGIARRCFRRCRRPDCSASCGNRSTSPSP